MKSKIVFLILPLLLLPATASAATVAELQAQLATLMAQLSALQQQGTAAPQSGAASCPNLTRNLSRGMKGTDVTQLQQFLISQKLLAADSATGFFGSLTEAAVKQWQAKNGVASSGTPATTGYGAVGPKTRSAMGRMCKGATPVTGSKQSVGQSTSDTSSNSATTQASQTTQTQTTSQPSSVSSNQSVSTQASTASTAGGRASIDFLIQDVCVNAQNQPIKGDPATCANHRDLKFGEHIPYLRTANPFSQANFALAAYPIQASDGSIRIFTPFDWGGVATSHGFGDFDNTGGSDGGNIFEASGEYASIIWTRDTSGTGFFVNGNCQYDDTWGLFPMNLARGQSGTRTFNFNISSSMQCGGNPWTSYTEWVYIGPYTYDSGKTLDSIKVTHFEGALSNFGNIEVLYFTREYGWTRWESWQDSGRDDQSCSGSQNQSFHGKQKVLWGCHDDTYITELSTPYNPLANPAGGGLNYSLNILNAGDFAQGYSFMKAFDGEGGQKTDFAVNKDTSRGMGNNQFFNAACWGGCGGYNSVYQDVAPQLSGSVNLRFGGLVKAAGSAQATLALFLYDAQGNVIGSPKVPVTIAGNTWQSVDSTFAWNFSAQPISKIRYQWYISTGAVLYSFDDMYLVPSR